MGNVVSIRQTAQMPISLSASYMMSERQAAGAASSVYRAIGKQERYSSEFAQDRVSVVGIQTLKAKDALIRQLMQDSPKSSWMPALFPNGVEQIDVVMFCMDDCMQLHLSLFAQYQAVWYCMQQCGWKGEIYFLPYNICALLLESASKYGAESGFTHFAQQMRQQFGIDIRMYTSGRRKNGMQIREYMQSGIAHLHACQYYGKKLRSEEIQNIPQNWLKECRNEIEKLCGVCCFEQSIQRLKAFARTAHAAFCNPAGVKRSVTRLLCWIGDKLLENGLPDLMDSCEEPILERIINAVSPTALESALETLSLRVMEMERNQNHDMSEPIVQTLEYIRQNYWRPLRQEEVAIAVHINKSYLSKLFQKKLGITYSRYLEHVRIQEAKRLLRTTNKTAAEIAEAVGFSEQNYFAKIFKNAVGVSPIKFRNGGYVE